MSLNEVEASLGAPLRRLTRGETIVSTYDVRQRLRECRYHLGPLPLQPARTEWHQLELTFGRGGLERALHREDAPNRKVERTLVGSVMAR